MERPARAGLSLFWQVVSERLEQQALPLLEAGWLGLDRRQTK
jgi:hypothetical protein